MNKICPLMLVSKNSSEVTVAPGVGSGTYACIGDICAGHRTDVNGNAYCGVAGKSDWELPRAEDTDTEE